MAHHEYRSGRSRIMGGRHFHGHFGRYHRLRIDVGSYDPAIRGRQGHRHIGGIDRTGPVRILHGPELLGADPVRRSIWPRCRRRGCGPQQLRGHPLRKPPHELVARHVGYWCADGPIHHGICVECGTRLVMGVSLHLHPADRLDGHIDFQPAVMETTGSATAKH